MREYHEKNNQGNKVEQALKAKVKKQLEDKLAAVQKEIADAKLAAGVAGAGVAAAGAAAITAALLVKEKNVKIEQSNNATLETELRDLFPKVKEANMIAKELKRNITFEMRQAPANYSQQAQFGDKVIIKVDYHSENYFQLWSLQEFEDRLFMMRNIIEDYREDGVINQDITTDKSKDPFHDPPQPVCVGMAFVDLKPLAQGMKHIDRTQIIMSRTA